MEWLLALWPDAPWLQAGVLCLVFTFFTWLFSVITKEYSWVDRMWSVAPPIYAIYVAGSEGFADTRINIMTLLITAWGARLTFNYARKGGYWIGGEDYRWSILQARMTGWQFQLFNATFISPFQMGLIYLFTSPLHAAWVAKGTPLNALDAVGATLFGLLLLLETVADEQMWAFQQDKKARVARGETVSPPFFSKGLYRYSRHPNYFAEVGQWWALVLLAVGATGDWLTWTWSGAFVLSALFFGSTRFTESISASKYPGYTEYQKTTSAFFPWFPGRSSESEPSVDQA